jgi:hypothetical protein
VAGETNPSVGTIAADSSIGRLGQIPPVWEGKARKWRVVTSELMVRSVLDFGLKMQIRSLSFNPKSPMKNGRMRLPWIKLQGNACEFAMDARWIVCNWVCFGDFDGVPALGNCAVGLFR